MSGWMVGRLCGCWLGRRGKQETPQGAGRCLQDSRAPAAIPCLAEGPWSGEITARLCCTIVRRGPLPTLSTATHPTCSRVFWMATARLSSWFSLASSCSCRRSRSCSPPLPCTRGPRPQMRLWRISLVVKEYSRGGAVPYASGAARATHAPRLVGLLRPHNASDRPATRTCFACCTAACSKACRSAAARCLASSRLLASAICCTTVSTHSAAVLGPDTPAPPVPPPPAASSPPKAAASSGAAGSPSAARCCCSCCCSAACALPGCAASPGCSTWPAPRRSSFRCLIAASMLLPYSDRTSAMTCKQGPRGVRPQ